MNVKVTRATHERVVIEIPLGQTPERRERILSVQVAQGDGDNRNARYVQVWMKSVGPYGGGRDDPGALVGSFEIDMREPVEIPGVFGGVV